jgi:hypothetical protein
MKDLRKLSLDRFCNFVWWVMTRNLETEADLAKLKAQVWKPPAGFEPTEGPWSAESEMAAFRNLKAALGQ